MAKSFSDFPILHVRNELNRFTDARDASVFFTPLADAANCQEILQQDLGLSPPQWPELTSDVLLKHRRCLLNFGLATLQKSEWSEAKRIFLLALELPTSDRETTALCHLGLAHAYFHLGKHAQSEQEALLTRELSPQLPETYWLLAQISYAQENFLKTLTLLDHAFHYSSQKDSHVIAQFQDKVLRELEVEEAYTQRESTHFIIKYDLNIRDELIEELRVVLESSFAQIQDHLSLVPERLITVVVYDPGEYQKVTHGPTWSAALFDGKVRLPLSASLTSLNNSPEGNLLQQTILHECVHAFLQQSVGPNLPTWVNEGLAQFIAEERHTQDWQVLQQLVKESLLLPISSLESSFLQLNREHAKRAYLESFAVVSLLHQESGWFGLRSFMQDFAKGMTTDSALRDAYHLSLEEMDMKLVEHIQTKNGIQR